MQYFEIGEEVVVCSTSSPEFNGDAIVLEVVGPQTDIWKNPHEDSCCAAENNFSYWLSISVPFGEFSGYFDQGALRKKPKPATESMSEMMANLNKLMEEG